MPAESPIELRAALRAALKERMLARDRVAVDALRVAIAAIENAEAQPLDGVPDSVATAMELAPSTAEVARRDLDGQAARALVTAEADELDATAGHYGELGQEAAAQRARHQADVLRAVLAASTAPDA